MALHGQKQVSVVGTCILAGLLYLVQKAQAELRASVYASGLNGPGEFVQSPSEPAVQYVIEQARRIRILHNGVLQPTNLLDLSGQISSGGQRGNDPNQYAQAPSSLLGKILRIDVSVPDSDRRGYQIPPGNPFFGAVGLTEIWDIGLRNPWKFSFDDPGRRGTDALIIADVGQGSWEEVDYEPRDPGGRNYGWRNREGAHKNVTTLPPAFLPLTDPITEYDHATGRSITGGHCVPRPSLSRTAGVGAARELLWRRRDWRVNPT